MREWEMQTQLFSREGLIVLRFTRSLEGWLWAILQDGAPMRRRVTPKNQKEIGRATKSPINPSG